MTERQTLANTLITVPTVPPNQGINMEGERTAASHPEHIKLVRSRVEQLDALELDDEILHVLKNQISATLKFLPLSFQGKCEPEINAVLRLVLLHLSTHGAGATFGQQLLSLKFSESQRRASMIAVMVPIFATYLQYRVGDMASKLSNQALKKYVRNIVHWAEVSTSIGNFVNLIVFLHNGCYPNLLYRILNLRMVHASVHSRERQVGYSHMTRELVWHGFIELLVFVLPLINYHVIKHKLVELVTFGSWSKSDFRTKQHIELTLKTRCAVCLRRPILPHHIDCGHSFCFYCLQANVLADSNFPCPTCGHKAEGMSSVKKVLVTITS